MVSNDTADGETIILLDSFKRFFRRMAIVVFGSSGSREPLLVEAFRRAHFFEEDLQSPRQSIRPSAHEKYACTIKIRQKELYFCFLKFQSGETLMKKQLWPELKSSEILM